MYLFIILVHPFVFPLTRGKRRGIRTPLCPPDTKSGQVADISPHGGKKEKKEKELSLIIVCTSLLASLL